DLRTRDIVIADLTTGEMKTLATDHDPKWWSVPASSRPEPEPSPDGRWIAFLSDRDGWDHLYVVPSDGGTVAQITSGSYEVRHPRWAPDSRRLAFDMNDGANPGQRHLAVATLDGTGRSRVTVLTHGRGTDVDPVWAPRRERLLFQHTDSRSPAN